MKKYDIFVHANGREKQVSTTFSLEGAKQMMKQYCDDHPDVSLGALTAVGPDGEYDMYDLFDIRDVGGKKILVSSTDIYADSDINLEDKAVDLLTANGISESDSREFMSIIAEMIDDAIISRERDIDDLYDYE